MKDKINIFLHTLYSKKHHQTANHLGERGGQGRPTHSPACQQTSSNKVQKS